MKKLWVILLFINYSCTSLKLKSTTPVLDKQGHRGCRGLMPENTLPAIIKAIELGVKTLEMDVVISKDGKVVVSHEPFFSHEITTTPKGEHITEKVEKQYNLYAMDYAEIVTYDVGLKVHPRFLQQTKMQVVKPLLEELIDSVEQFTSTHKRQKMYYNIETKCLPETDDVFHPRPDTFCEHLMKVLIDKKIADRTIIQSFDIRTLQYIHKQYPAMQTALLIDEGDTLNFDKQIEKLGFRPHVYSPHYSMVNAALISRCHELTIKVIPWTVNDVAIMQQLQLLGVDGIISDYPNLFSALQ